MAKYHVGSDGTVTDSAGNERPDIAAKAGNLLPNDHRNNIGHAGAADMRREAKAENPKAEFGGSERNDDKYPKGRLS